LAALGVLLDPASDPGRRVELCGDPQGLVELAGLHLVTPALRRGMRALGLDGDLPDELASFLAAVEALNVRRNRRLAAQAAELAGALNALDIEPVFLKGTALLLLGLYPDPSARLIGDIDLLVPVDRLDDAAAALRGLGYADLEAGPAHAHDPQSLAHPERPAMVELHRSPVPLPLEPLLPSLELQARAVPLPGLGAARARAPCPTHLALHNLLHAMLQHRCWRLANLPMRDALDLVLLDRRFGAAIDWETLAGRAAGAPGGRDALAFYTGAARAVFPAAGLPRFEPGWRARLALRRWRGRHGRPPGRLMFEAVRLAAFAEDLAWRLRHLPSERRRLGALALAPRRWPGYIRHRLAMARDPE
jgi:hypothetical protein